jgi:hypothetical protein
VVTSGFQNSHVHFMERRFDAAAHLPAAQLERDVLAMTSRYGFTTVFDTGSDVTKHHRPASTHREGRDSRAAHPHRRHPALSAGGHPVIHPRPAAGDARENASASERC